MGRFQEIELYVTANCVGEICIWIWVYSISWSFSESISTVVLERSVSDSAHSHRPRILDMASGARLSPGPCRGRVVPEYVASG
jgi:hypothetical protein